MFDDCCINIFKRMRLLNKRVHTHFSRDFTRVYPNAPTYEVKYRYVNNTGDDLLLMLSSGLAMVIPHTPAKNKSYEGHFYVLETLNVPEDTTEMLFQYPEMNDDNAKAYKALIDIYARPHVDRFADNTIHHHVAIEDIKESKHGVLFPGVQITVGLLSRSSSIKNLAVEDSFSIENDLNACGRRFRFYSKDDRTNIYLVFGNEVLKLASSKRDVAYDFIEVYDSDKNGKEVLVKSLTLEETMTDGYLGTKFFRHEIDANTFRDELQFALKNKAVLEGEIVKLRKYSKATEDAFEAYKRKAADDESRAKATIWTKIGSIFSSFASICSTAWASFRSIF